LEEVEAFEARHPIGTKARLAMAILLYTSWRREDAVRLGPQYVRDGRIKYRQAKNEHRNPVDMDIPLHPDLAEIIAATPSLHMGEEFDIDRAECRTHACEAREAGRHQRALVFV
jgi:integrase/recombinase XerD